MNLMFNRRHSRSNTTKQRVVDSVSSSSFGDGTSTTNDSVENTEEYVAYAILPTHTKEHTLLHEQEFQIKRADIRRDRSFKYWWSQKKQKWAEWLQSMKTIDREGGRGWTFGQEIAYRCIFRYLPFTLFYIGCLLLILFLIGFNPLGIGETSSNDDNTNPKALPGSLEAARKFNWWEPTQRISERDLHSLEEWKKYKKVTDVMLAYMRENKDDCLTARDVGYDYDVIILFRRTVNSYLIMWNARAESTFGSMNALQEPSQIDETEKKSMSVSRPSGVHMKYTEWIGPHSFTEDKKYRASCALETRSLLHCLEILSGDHYIRFSSVNLT